MSVSRHYNAVAFDVRDNATLLFFARTTPTGDIEDYVLVMRTLGEEFDDTLFLEINEMQFAGNELIREATMSENMLTLHFANTISELGNASELVLTFDATADNKTSMEAGVFRVLGEKLSGGHA